MPAYVWLVLLCSQVLDKLYGLKNDAIYYLSYPMVVYYGPDNEPPDYAEKVQYIAPRRYF